MDDAEYKEFVDKACDISWFDDCCDPDDTINDS